jgi:hypothetical protein
MLVFDIYETKIGTHEDIKERTPSTKLKIEEHTTLANVKLLVLETLYKERDGDIRPSQLRVREIERDFRIGSVLRADHK